MQQQEPSELWHLKQLSARRATTLILLDVLPLCVSETVVTCLVCVSSVNTQTFSVFYSTNRHFTGEQTMRSAPRLREQFPPSGLPLCLIFLYFVAFLCICGCFVDLCGSRWIIDFHEETNTRCLVFATYKTTRTWEGEVHSKITSTYFASGLQHCLSNTVVFDLLSFAKLTFLNYSESKWRLYP